MSPSSSFRLASFFDVLLSTYPNHIEPASPSVIRTRGRIGDLVLVERHYRTLGKDVSKGFLYSKRALWLMPYSGSMHGCWLRDLSEGSKTTLVRLPWWLRVVVWVGATRWLLRGGWIWKV